MGTLNKKTSKLTEKDKKFIKEMKEYLSMMGIPREEWSKIIQREMKQQKRFKGLSGLMQGTSDASGVKGKVKGKIGKVVNKIMSKRMGLDDKALSDLQGAFGNPYDSMSAADIDMMEAFFPKLDIGDVDELGKGGCTFVMDRPDKKRKIIDFDDFDDDD